ncbi:type IV pilin protein [Lysobacter sp. GCM10012299]|uniref:type IV pilin protein n=1 Tax=Lysobacter sp. GCM10012299 TaxID=3317333 RepID=UPI003623D8B0
MKTASNRYRVSGFTLIELMIAVLVVAVLMAIAYPSYNNHVVKSRRAAAAACTIEVSQFMERYYSTNLKYRDASSNAPAIPNMQCRTDLAAHYTIGLAGGTTDTTYTAQAVPVAGSQQAARDTKCATIGITQAGVKTESGTAASAAECW